MTEDDYLERYDPNAFDRPSVTVDLVLMSVIQSRPVVLLVRRDEHPFLGQWALPGGFVGIEEGLDQAARRILHDKAGMERVYCEQLYTFGDPGRDPRMRVITVAYMALLPAQHFARIRTSDGLAIAEVALADGDARALSPHGGALPLAFDHAGILAAALRRLRGKLDYSDLPYTLLPERFTLRELQDVHEAILGRPLNKPAFRRRMLERGSLAPTGEREGGTSFRPAELYRHVPAGRGTNG